MLHTLDNLVPKTLKVGFRIRRLCFRGTWNDEIEAIMYGMWIYIKNEEYFPSIRTANAEVTSYTLYWGWATAGYLGKVLSSETNGEEHIWKTAKNLAWIYWQHPLTFGGLGKNKALVQDSSGYIWSCYRRICGL